ncbi:isopropyl malate isomerase large subunit 1 [Tanacetum coccineum]
MTMTEKILSRASEKSQLIPGENVWVNIDILMTHDLGGPGCIGIFKKEFGNDAKVWDREKVVIIPDHYIFTSDEKANRNVDIIRDFSHEQGIKYFYDIKDLSNFKVLVGTDSHTCTAGAFGQFATGIGNTDAGFVFGTGKLLLKVPPSLRFVLDGEMPDYLLAKDLILHVIKDGGIHQAGKYRDLVEDPTSEFARQIAGHSTSFNLICHTLLLALQMGSNYGMAWATEDDFRMEERMTLCNMVEEDGGKNCIIPTDATTFKYLEPHSPDNRALARECKDVKIDRVYIGSCTGGKTEDFLAAARGEKVKVPTFLVPATQKVWMDIYTLPVPGSGGKTCSQIFEAAGCDTPASPSCAACLGGPKDTYARINEPQARQAFHSGNHTTVKILSKLAGKGRYFDFCSRLIPASVDYAAKISPLCTRLCKDGYSVRTAEHLLFLGKSE